MKYTVTLLGLDGKELCAPAPFEAGGFGCAAVMGHTAYTEAGGQLAHIGAVHVLLAPNVQLAGNVQLNQPERKQ